MRYGMKLPTYDENYSTGLMKGVLAIFLPLLALTIAIAFSMTIFSINFDFLLLSATSDAYQDSIISRTIFGKILFVIAFFVLVVAVRNLLPAWTKGGKKLVQTVQETKKGRKKKKKGKNKSSLYK